MPLQRRLYAANLRFPSSLESERPFRIIFLRASNDAKVTRASFKAQHVDGFLNSDMIILLHLVATRDDGSIGESSSSDVGWSSEELGFSAISAMVCFLSMTASFYQHTGSLKAATETKVIDPHAAGSVTQSPGAHSGLLLDLARSATYAAFRFERASHQRRFSSHTVSHARIVADPIHITDFCRSSSRLRAG